MDRTSLVQELFEARHEGRATDLEEIPVPLDEALSIQLEVATQFLSAGESIGGWKVGMTSASSKDKLGPDVRPFGFILRSRILSSGAEIAGSSVLNAAVEPELCLILSSALHGDVSKEEARNAIGSVAAAMEINEFRIIDGNTKSLLVADGLANWGIVVGSRASKEVLDRSITVEVECNGKTVARATSGLDLDIDDHVITLCRLSSSLADHGLRLEAGSHVITGKFAGGFSADAPGAWLARYLEIGTVELTVT